MVVVYGIFTGLVFGLVPISVRHALYRHRDAEAGAAILLVFGCLVVGFAAAARNEFPEPLSCWPFFLVGFLVPGAMQLTAVLAVQAAGASRASVLISTAPILSATLAIVLLDEPVRVPVIVGILLIVAGCVSLAQEKVRPADFRAIGILLAFTAAAMLAARDNIVRWLSESRDVPPLAAATSALLGGALLVLAWATVVRRTDPLRAAPTRYLMFHFITPGVLVGVGTAGLFLALEAGDVTIVAPLNATAAMWTVLFASLFLQRGEHIGSKLVVAAALVVAGGALISGSA